MQKLAHPDGEIATSRAAAKMGIPMCLSSYGNTSLEEVKLQGNGNPYIMQICIVRDRHITQQLIKRASGKLGHSSVRLWAADRCRCRISGYLGIR